jgi:hypothetical protein
MFNNDEKPKNKRSPGVYNRNLPFLLLGVVIAIVAGGLARLILGNPRVPAQNPIPELNGMEFGVDAAQGWQATGLRLEEGQRFIISYREGDWSIFPEDSFRYGPDGGASACEGSDCVEPLAGYTKSGLIGRIGDSQPFVVGGYLETTAEDSGMLQLRVNDAGTHDNEGFITVLLTWEN